MSDLPICPKCSSAYTYEDGNQLIGTKVKNIFLVEGDHNIDCKIDGFGPMELKSEFVKKA
ncbi:PhnA domain-containing protein [Planococcus sp. YIM B11945]|uniref:PhnA domain-containing protein n=1 Tax=Planococcus sp. YIM B11945 TaxID=3435410 RepID=UPI003D7C7817